MKVEGDAAKGYQAVRKDSFANAHQGELVMADDQTGEGPLERQSRRGQVPHAGPAHDLDRSADPVPKMTVAATFG